MNERSWMMCLAIVSLHDHMFANVPFNTFSLQFFPRSSLFSHNALSSCLMQISLLDHSIKLVKLLITGPPLRDKLQPLGQRTWDLKQTIHSFDLNGVLCHTKHIPKVPMRAFHHPKEKDFDGKLDTLINRKVVHAHPGLLDLLREMLNFAHIVMWSSMVMENMEPIVNFLFHDLLSPCLILDQEACDELLDEKDLPMPKFGDQGGGQQFLKVLMSKLWRGVPHWRGYPTGASQLLRTPSSLMTTPLRAFWTPRARSSCLTRELAIKTTHFWSIG